MAYFRDNWNKFDFAINLAILPSFSMLFIQEDSSLFFLTILRLIRIIKFFRFFKFIPNIEHIFVGIQRAMKASIFIIFSFFLYLFIVSIFSCFFFKEVSPEHFGDPLVALYSTFKIFTIEGWFELPELISKHYGEVASFFVKIYFIFLVLSGGVFGMSLINAIFVDEMVSDNNDEVLKEIGVLKNKIDEELKEIREIKENLNEGLKEIRESKNKD